MELDHVILGIVFIDIVQEVVNSFGRTRKRESAWDGTDLVCVTAKRLYEKSQLAELFIDIAENFFFLFGKIDEFWEQELLAILRNIVLERFHRLFKEHSRVGGVLVDNQKPVGIFSCNVCVCNLEE